MAREALERHPGSSVVVLEREREPARHQSARNSGVIHAGLYYTPGSLRARLCVEGARLLYDYCEVRAIPAKRTGKLIVAVRPDELPRLEELEARGHRNEVPGLRRVESDELRRIEPHATGLAALHSPATGVVDFSRVAAALADDVQRAGGELITSCPVATVAPEPGAVRLHHAGGETRARQAVVCAGPWSDRLAVAAGAPEDPRIVPFRGQYMRLRAERRQLVRTLIYPVPDPALPFLGVHLTRHVDGEVLLGPTARLAATRDVNARRPAVRDVTSTLSWPGSWRLARRHWRAGARELRRLAGRETLAREAARYVPELRAEDLEPAFSGVRAQALTRDGRLVDDFVVSETGRAIHVRNAPSPAATSALALARVLVDRVDWI